MPVHAASRIVFLFLLLLSAFMLTSYSAIIVSLLQTTSSAINSITELLNSQFKLSMRNITYSITYVNVSTWHHIQGADKSLPRPTSRCILFDGENIKFDASLVIYTVSQEERARLREGVPYVKVYRYNPKHLCPNLNGYGDNGHRILKL